MNLFHKYQSRAFQFTLFLLAELEAKKSLSQKDITDLAEKLRLDYADQVLQPLCQANILKKQDSRWVAGDDFIPFFLSAGTVELDYLQYILDLPEAELFLDPSTIDALRRVGGNSVALQAIQRIAPQGAPIPTQPGREGIRLLRQAIRERRLIHYCYRTRDDQCYRECIVMPWKIEYSAYDRRWWVILYDHGAKRTIKARLDNLKDISLQGPADIPEEEVDRAMDRLFAPEPVVLQVQHTRGALERCFLVFENQMFLETRQISPEYYSLSFRYYRFDEKEIQRKLLYLGSAVRLISPHSMRQELLGLVRQALKQ